MDFFHSKIVLNVLQSPVYHRAHPCWSDVFLLKCIGYEQTSTDSTQVWALGGPGEILAPLPLRSWFWASCSFSLDLSFLIYKSSSLHVSPRGFVKLKWDYVGKGGLLILLLLFSDSPTQLSLWLETHPDKGRMVSRRPWEGPGHEKRLWCLLLSLLANVISFFRTLSKKITPLRKHPLIPQVNIGLPFFVFQQYLPYISLQLCNAGTRKPLENSIVRSLMPKWQYRLGSRGYKWLCYTSYYIH